MISTWPCPLHDGRVSEELVVRLGPGDGPSLLIIPPLFAEHNLMRRQTVLTMRQLAEMGFHTVLPDLPGWNESTQPLSSQTLTHWRSAIVAAVEQFQMPSVVAMRSGALLAPYEATGCLYAPHSGAKLLRAMVRAQSLANRENGTLQSSEELVETGRTQGVFLGGWMIGAEMFRELETAQAPITDGYGEISQSDLDGAGLWLRAEPGEDEKQAQDLAKLIADNCGGMPGKNS